MMSVMNGIAAERLERSCGVRDWVRTAPPEPGIERIAAHFAGHAYDPHRHDTYAIGITLEGVQVFGYRGTEVRSGPGQIMVLHPDERHDGHAGADDGFAYRMLYIAPALIRDALGPGTALPFVPEALSGDRRLARAVMPALEDLTRPLDDLQRDELIFDLATALQDVSGVSPATPTIRFDRAAVNAARDRLEADLEQPVLSGTLEAATGLSRYVLARQFRACFGTSPYRYRVLRRLDHVRAQIQAGATLAGAAIASGFADQSHMARHFKRAYGITPGRWAAVAHREV